MTLTNSVSEMANNQNEFSGRKSIKRMTSEGPRNSKSLMFVPPQIKVQQIGSEHESSGQDLTKKQNP